MRKLFAFAALLALSACDDGGAMTNDHIIAETKKCIAAGLKAEAIVHGTEGSRIYAIQCSPTK